MRDKIATVVATALLVVAMPFLFASWLALGCAIMVEEMIRGR